MKKEELMKLEGMTDSLADKVMGISSEEMKNFVPKSRFDEVIAERNHARDDHADVLKQLGVLRAKDTDAEDLKAQISKLQEEAKKTKEAHEAELFKIRLNNSVENDLRAANCLNLAAGKALLNLEKSEFEEDGHIKGLADQIEALQTSEDSKMLFGSSVPKMKGAQIGASGDDIPDAANYEQRLIEARKSGNQVEAIKIKQEAAGEGVYLL